MAGLYIHIPFCESRCAYCGFYSTTLHSEKQRYVDALLREIELRKAEFDEELHTIYIGGGTPSVLPLPLLQKLIDGVSSVLDTSKVKEWTIECNPDDLVNVDFTEWLGKRSPINRVSMGAQTFNDERLSWLHRRHTSSQVSIAIANLRASGISNISVDLMFGFPQQTIEEWQEDINILVKLRPQHISAYSLMYEEDTPLFNMLERGEIEELDEDICREMYYLLIDKLGENGYEQYEISNFSLKGYHSLHNSSYWNDKKYIGIGAAAHSYNRSQRTWNVSDVHSYIQNISSGILPSEGETIDEVTHYNDIITTAMRTQKGIKLSDLTPFYREYLLSQTPSLLANGLVDIADGYIRLTRKGLYVSDDVMSELIYS